MFDLSGTVTSSDSCSHAFSNASPIIAPNAESDFASVVRTVAVTFRAPYTISNTPPFARTFTVALRTPESSAIELADTFALKPSHFPALGLSNTVAIASTESYTNIGANAGAFASSFASTNACAYPGSISTRCGVRRGVVQNDHVDRSRCSDAGSL